MNNDIVEFMRRFEKKVESGFQKMSEEIGIIQKIMSSITSNVEMLQNDVKRNDAELSDSFKNGRKIGDIGGTDEKDEVQCEEERIIVAAVEEYRHGYRQGS